MNRRVATILWAMFCVATGLMFTAVAAFADYYKYTDGTGAVVITNKKESVPSKYRGSMKVVKEDSAGPAGAQKPVDHDPVQEEAASSPQPAVPAAAVPEGKFAELCSRFPWLRPVAYVLGAIVALLAVIKVTSLLPSRQLARTICIAFFLGAIVFIYKSYVDHVADSYSTIRTKAVDAVKKSNERTLPQLNEVTDGNASPAESGGK